MLFCNKEQKIFLWFDLPWASTAWTLVVESHKWQFSLSLQVEWTEEQSLRMALIRWMICWMLNLWRNQHVLGAWWFFASCCFCVGRWLRFVEGFELLVMNLWRNRHFVLVAWWFFASCWRIAWELWLNAKQSVKSPFFLHMNLNL